VLTHRFGLDRWQEAFDTTASGASGKVILTPAGDGAMEDGR
jgi:hypothetical protein